MLDQGKSVRSPPAEEKGVIVYDELITAPIPRPPVLLERQYR